MLSRLRAIVLLMAISSLWTSCQGQETTTNDNSTSHPTTLSSVQSITNDINPALQTTNGLSSAILTSSVPTGNPATTTASLTVNSSSSSVTSLNTFTTDIIISTNKTDLTTPESSTSSNSTLPDLPLTTSGENTTYNSTSSDLPLTTSEVNTTYTPLNGSSTTAPVTSTTVNTTAENFSSTAGSPENNTDIISTSANVSTTTTSSLTTANTTTLSVSTDFTDTHSTSFYTNSTSQAPSSEVTPLSNVSTSITTTSSMTLTTGYLATTNQSDWSGNSKDIESNTGVVLGAIFGSLLGVVLVCVAAYFLCGSKKTSNFSHRRLYEETRNDPVLRLDNPVSPYDVSYGESSFYNPTVIEEPSYNGGRPHETIVMDDIRPR